MPKRRQAKNDRRHSRVEWIGFLERRLHEALLGSAPLRALVAELGPPSSSESDSNWAPGLVRDEAGNLLGLLSRNVLPVPALENRMDVSTEPGGIVRLSFKLAHLPPRAAGDAEFSIYADADDADGIAILDAFDALGAGTWNLPVGERGQLPYPLRGNGRFWIDDTGTNEWTERLPLPFDERYLRLPYRLLHASLDFQVRIRLGQVLAADVARLLRGRIYLNHLTLVNRTVERIEPDASDRSHDEIVLQGPSPLLLDLTDIRTGSAYFDHRYASVAVDPARLVRLARSGSPAAFDIRFPGRALSRRHARLSYWRALDWRDLTVRPGKTVLDLNRTPCLRVRTAIHPPASRRPLLAQTRRALVSLFTEPERPRYPSLQAIARAVRKSLPRFVRPWIDDSPTPDYPLGMKVQMRALPDQDGYASPTWDIGLFPKDRAPTADLKEHRTAIAKRIELRLGGAFPVRVTWVFKETSHD